MSSGRSSTITLLAGLALVPTLALAQSAVRLDQSLTEARREGRSSRVIVKAKAGYRAWLKQQLAAQGKEVGAEHESIDALSVELSAADLDAVCGGPAADGCSVDAVVSPSASFARLGTADPVASNTALAAMGLSTGRRAGAGVTVALIDSGIHPSAAFAGRIAAFFDFTQADVTRSVPHDDYGHGTHVAGLIGGRQQAEDRAVQGVAPLVRFVGMKVLDASGRGRTSNVIRALEFAVANRRRLGIDIINLSLGHPIFEAAATDPLVQAVEKAVQAGIIVVASAGNYGVGANGQVGFAGITSPGNAPSAITVGAFNHNDTAARGDDRLSLYSSRGPTWYDGLAKPDLSEHRAGNVHLDLHGR
jgi:serine protease AprX